MRPKLKLPAPLMRDAAAEVLRGYELPSDVQIKHHGESFFDKRGKEMWETITRLLAKLERGCS